MRELRDALLIAAGLMSVIATPASSAGDAERGAALFRACAPCHSLKPDQNMTGPSLAGLWERKAGSLASFDRYSPALKSSEIVWDDKSLDVWLKSPQSLVQHNGMIFKGIPDAQQRSDLIAFLKVAGAGHAAEPAMASGFQDLKKLGADRQVEAIRYCRDTYYVTTADGKTADFWEANLRFKTDSSNAGPIAGKPAILPAGMMGDRASVFFASPEEISTFIKHQC
jgi:cytochrome c